MVFAIFTFFAFVFRKKNRKIRKVRKVKKQKSRKTRKVQKIQKVEKQKNDPFRLFYFSCFSCFSTFRARSHFSNFREKTDLEVFRFSTFLLFVFFLFFDLSRMRRTGPLFIFLKKSDVQVFQQFSIFYARGRFLFFRTFEQSSGRLAFLYFLSRMNLVSQSLCCAPLPLIFSFCCRGARQFFRLHLRGGLGWWFGSLGNQCFQSILF